MAADGMNDMGMASDGECDATLPISLLRMPIGCDMMSDDPFMHEAICIDKQPAPHSGTRTMQHVL